MKQTKEHKEKRIKALLEVKRGESLKKYCPKCKKYRLRKSFDLRLKTNSLGRQYSESYCRDCHKAYAIERVKKHIENNPVYFSDENIEKRALINRKACFKRNYGITLDYYETLSIKQGGVCAICKGLQNSKNKKYLCIDHCHNTNKIRGLLCSRCNTLLGQAKDNINILEESIKYLTSNTRDL